MNERTNQSEQLFDENKMERVAAAAVVVAATTAAVAAAVVADAVAIKCLVAFAIVS